MAVDASALTLPQYALMSNSPIVRQVTMSMLEAGSILADIPFINKKTLIAQGVRWSGDTLPDPDWTPINVDPTVVNAVPSAYSEQAYTMRNAIDTDNVLVEDENQIVDPRAARLDAYLKAVAYVFNHNFINNTPTNDPHAPIGLRYRLDNPTVFGSESELKIDGGAVDLRLANMTAATANAFINKVDRLLYLLGSPSGQGVTLYMNQDLKDRFAFAVRLLGSAGFTTSRDAFDRSVEMYKGANIRTAGRKKDQTTEIILSTETTAGVDGSGSDDYTSLYGVKFGMDGLFGWQFRSLGESVRNLGLLDNGITWRTVIDWQCGLMQTNTRAIGRIYNILMS